MRARAMNDSTLGRRRHKTSITLLVAVFALAGGAAMFAPTSAAAKDEAGTGSLCFERAPGEFVDLLTGEKCEPTAESAGGERIEIEGRST
jgi:hypothetical protein